MDERQMGEGQMGESLRIGEGVRRRRESLGLTQVELAVLADVSEGSIRNLEAGAGNPRARTWVAVQAVLGWAPKSLNRLRADKEPVEIFPAEDLQQLLKDFILGQNSPANIASAARDFRDWVSLVNERGEFKRHKDVESFFGVLSDYGWHLAGVEFEQVGEDDYILHGPRVAYEEFLNRIRQNVRVAVEADPPQPPKLPVERFLVGDRVRDPRFGLGRVIALGATLPDGKVLSETEGVRVRFDDSGVRHFMLRHCSLRRVEDKSYRLPRGLNESVRDLQIIDYLTTTPSQDDENLVVVALLAKRDPDRPFSALDTKVLRSFQEWKDRGVSKFMEEA